MASVGMMVTDGQDQRPLISSDTVLDLANASTTFLGQFRTGALPLASRFMVFTTPAAVAVGCNDIVSAALAANSATMTATIAAQPDMARNVRIYNASGWDGGSVTVVGTFLGSPQTEVFTQAQIAGTTAIGLKPFTTITSITKSAVGATGNTIVVGVGNSLGTQAALKSTVGLAWLASSQAFDAATLSTTYNTYIPTTAPSGDSYWLLAGV